jgi:hypothetical protein
VKRYAGIWAVNREALKVLPLGGGVALFSFLMADLSLFVTLPVLGVLYVVMLYCFRLLPFDIKDKAEGHEDRH